VPRTAQLLFLRKTGSPQRPPNIVSISQKVGAGGSRTRKEVRSEWKKNDRVEHKVFGVGVVLDVYRENDNDKIDILFDNVGRKTLLLTYAKLTRI
jgi:hypothetical protein